MLNQSDLSFSVSASEKMGGAWDAAMIETNRSSVEEKIASMVVEGYAMFTDPPKW